jgi:chromosome segregation protein
MVKLNKISMQGFKSFKNKTTILIGDGLTSITGANGSGKSNILDAFSFVLGKNSAKALRADKMEDLIFKSENGRVESAKVELEIDNQDRKIKLDFDKILISRRVNQQGQSTYRLNGKVETRQMIVDLLREARISPDWLNIVCQGDVTRVLEMSPLERRFIIDELAGLAEFDEKKRKSEVELHKVEEILREQNLLLREREKLFENISEEKRKVEIFNNLNEKIKKLEFSISKNKLDTAIEKREKFAAKEKEIEEKLAKLDEDIKNIDLELDEKENQVKNLTKNILVGSREVEVIEEQEKLKSEILNRESNIESNKREIKRLERYIEQLTEIEKPKAIKFLLDKEGVLGTLDQIIKCDDKYRQAIDAALGSMKNDLIVEKFDKIDFYINYLKENKIGSARFLPLDKINGFVIDKPKGKGVVDIAIKLVKYDKKYTKVLEYALGSTLILNNLRDAKQFVNKYRIATLDGSVVEKSGSVFGGYKEQAFNTNKIKEEIKKLKQENKKLEEELEMFKKQLEEVSKKREDVTSKYCGVSEEITLIENQIKEIRDKRRKIYERRLRLQSDLSNEKIKLAKIEVEIKNYQDDMEEMELFDEVEKGTITELKDKIIRYSNEIRKLGPLNMKAVEEFDKYQKEYEDLKEKVEKIIEEKYAILKVVNEIESKRKEKFMDLFNSVNKEFKDIYHRFTEGEGYIALEEEDNIYSGLLIKAKPKGKRLLGIDSLSGGEKTVTAIAFLLAIQRCKPNFFVLLDEIDAALDKDNTKKIMDAIREFAKEQQYILITHNEATVAQSNQVYGIVSENGVSSVVGIKLKNQIR